ncbi:MAG: hypothetical protein APG12_00892 [Candidatus Methanofastidiosum methylothiophilum]|uniref:Uncharacterized protein n=1 Tax=Candidatus Methanofastidiosum methylothiophilum TaxID=1705564 RepID=A0A150IKK4_9EURY|nr:MAG: hypothetical protein APG10_01055 [Candidatus Methanofastidiosum methylthiophilus]KYC47270.1 MAG: hypothetical protein APG11_01313 [Candidatus Methanofastidiosum methylthiophilus]KYC50364.1 MAG: hypothetical protein APG12_00892 [Candidatus Methanofastidiosum methylthiophilus]
MRKVEALPYTIEELIKKVNLALGKANIEYFTAGREFYINEDLLLSETIGGTNKSLIHKIKEYLRNETEANYAIISFDSAPKGCYMIIEFSEHATFSALAKIFSLKTDDEVSEQVQVEEINDTKLERELRIINKDISGKEIESDDEEDGEEEYEYIDFGERTCKVCGSIIRRITVQESDGKVRDGYKCINTNCLKIYIIR